MNEITELHTRLESLEKRLAKARRELDTLDPARREGLGKLLETISESLDAQETAPRA